MHELHDTTVTSDVTSDVTSALNYKQGIERQLSSVDFFTDDSQTSILKNAPFTKTYYELDFDLMKACYFLIYLCRKLYHILSVSIRNAIF